MGNLGENITNGLDIFLEQFLRQYNFIFTKLFLKRQVTDPRIKFDR